MQTSCCNENALLFWFFFNFSNACDVCMNRGRGSVYWTDLRASGAAQRFQAANGRSSQGSKQTDKTHETSSASGYVAAAHTGHPLQRCKGQRLPCVSW